MASRATERIERGTSEIRGWPGSVPAGSGLDDCTAVVRLSAPRRAEDSRAGDPLAPVLDGNPAHQFRSLVGRSAAMKGLLERLAMVAESDVSVLITGETGTGKDLVARALHGASARSAAPFVVVDCAALPESLFESELFGHARGAFTGAGQAREGAFEAAEGGTLFLDEIGELPLSLQPKLLRVLETRTIRRIGESHFRPVDVRFVSATHRDLSSMVADGRFREDLYFRTAVVPVAVPPLRDRLDDLAELIEKFIPDSGPVPDEVLRRLRERDWIGNVRELRNFCERARTLGIAEALTMLPPTRARGDRDATSAGASSIIPIEPWITGEPIRSEESDEVSNLPRERETYRSFRDRWQEQGERIYLETTLERCGGNVTEAARVAGVDRSTYYRLLRRLAR